MKKLFSVIGALVLSTSMWADYYMAGNGSATNNWCCGINWSADGCAMTAGAYSAKVPAGTYEFKITEGDWAVSYGFSNVDATASTPGYEGSDNVKFTVTSEANINVTFDGMYIVLTSDVPFGSVAINSWTIAGVQALMGSNWSPSDTNNDMQFVGGAYQLVKSNVELAAGGYDYKACANHAWGIKEVPSSGNQTLTIAEAGTYDVTFSMDAQSTTLSAVAEKTVTPMVYDTVQYVAGNFTKWQSGMKKLPYKVALPKDSTLEFKQVRVITTKNSSTSEVVKTDTAWYGQATKDFTMTRDNVGQGWTLNGEHNVVLTTDIAGDYTFKLSGQSFVVVFPEPSSAIDETVGDKNQIKKMMKNNQMVIIRNGVWYNATGARIK